MTPFTIHLIVFFVGIVIGFACGIMIAMVHSGAKEDLIRKVEDQKRLIAELHEKLRKNWGHWKEEVERCSNLERANESLAGDLVKLQQKYGRLFLEVDAAKARNFPDEKVEAK